MNMITLMNVNVVQKDTNQRMTAIAMRDGGVRGIEFFAAIESEEFKWIPAQQFIHSE